MKPCRVCRNVGFVWGGLLHSPQMIRCKCSGGPVQPWWTPPGEEVSAMAPKEHTARGTNGRA